MGHLRAHAPVVGAAAVGCAVSAVVVGAFWLWSDVTRNRLHRPTPINPPLGWRVSW